MLGLPWGVSYGEVKALLEGVCGLSYTSFAERVCKSGGGIGIVKLGFPLFKGEIGGAAEAILRRFVV